MISFSRHVFSKLTAQCMYIFFFQIMMIDPMNEYWQRTRPIHHGGALRAYAKDPEDDGYPRGPEASPYICSMCEQHRKCYSLSPNTNSWYLSSEDDVDSGCEQEPFITDITEHSFDMEGNKYTQQLLSTLVLRWCLPQYGWNFAHEAYSHNHAFIETWYYLNMSFKSNEDFVIVTFYFDHWLLMECIFLIHRFKEYVAKGCRCMASSRRVILSNVLIDHGMWLLVWFLVWFLHTIFMIIMIF